MPNQKPDISKGDFDFMIEILQSYSKLIRKAHIQICITLILAFSILGYSVYQSCEIMRLESELAQLDEAEAVNQ